MAQSFVSSHGVRLNGRPLEQHRDFWLERDVPAEQIDRMIAFEDRWGGLVLPPAPAYDGGPICFSADSPEGTANEGWWFEAGAQRTAVPYSYMIGPHDEFGIHGPNWAPLHASIEGWIESVALAHHAALWARSITKLHGADVDALDLGGFEKVTEVRGLTDTWWRAPGSYIAIFRGDASALSHPARVTAHVYSGIPAYA